MVATTTVVLNPTFAHLSDDRTMRIKQNTSSLEKEAIVDITIGSAVTYTTGGITIDFSQIRNWKVVYYMDVAHSSYVLPIYYVPSTNNISSTGKIKFYDQTGAELVNGSTAIQNATIRVVIRGY